MKLRPYQEEAKRRIFEHWDQGIRSTLLVLPTGCHHPDQEILMYDGTIKTARHISTGELLMGMDGTPRAVLSVHTGASLMKRIVPKKGEPFIVTHDHILTLVQTSTDKKPQYNSERRGGNIVDVPVCEWEKWSNWKKHIHKLFRAGVNFQPSSEKLPLDPYVLGVLLGDGSFRTNASITTMDAEIKQAVEECIWFHGLKLVKTKVSCGKATCWMLKSYEQHQHALSRFRKSVLFPLGLDNKLSEDKHIPHCYKTASAEDRLSILAGIIDTDGSLTCNGYDFISKSKTLAEDVAFLVRSLGMAAYVSKCHKKCQTGNGGTYWRVSISGNVSEIPCRLQRKKAGTRQQKKSVNRTQFHVEDAGIGEYFGFTVNGDNRYLLGDFTVTHNCGKTIVFSSIIEEALRRGGRCLVLAHRAELLEQAADKLAKATGLGCAVEKAEQTAVDTLFNVVVGSVQTMQRLERRDGHEFSHIIVDEAHHAPAASYRAVLDHFPDAKVLGVTATADRGDKRNLGEVFETLAYEYSLPAAIRDGWLVRIKAQTIPLSINLTDCKQTAGDFQAADLGDQLGPYLEQIAGHIQEQAAGRKTVVFLPLVATSQTFCAMLQARGINAREVNGNSKDRSETLDWFNRAGKGSVLCNAMLLTEGWDQPDVDCICVLRPTKMRSLYAQMVGRGTRLHPGKQDLLLLDFLWHCERHELVRPAHLVCQNQDISKRVAEIMAEKSLAEPTDIMGEAEAGAESTAVQEREEALRKLLEEQRKRKRALVDPLQFEMSIDRAAKEYLPPADDLRAMGPPSTAQLKQLEKAGIFPDEVQCQGHASKLLDTIAKRRAEGLSTPRQIRCLEGKGFRNVGSWQFDAAKRMIDRIAGNCWQPPRDIGRPADYVPPQKAEVAAW